MVFVGYGIQAPEFQWDDFKGVDVKGKTILMLVNDPPIAGSGPGNLDPSVFGGKAMTYYGRWVYKFAKAAEMGAAGVLVIHETEPAGYPFSVAQGMGGERFNLVTPDKNMGRAAGSKAGSRSRPRPTCSSPPAWTLPHSRRRPRPATSRLCRSRPPRRSRSSRRCAPSTAKNVVAKITGSDPVLKDEFVIYSAHWDHLGVTNSPRDGDAINNGAMGQRQRHGRHA
jgi:Zn-dependent M28 family amino/carboxypeptidase